MIQSTITSKSSMPKSIKTVQKTNLSITYGSNKTTTRFARLMVNYSMPVSVNYHILPSKHPHPYKDNPTLPVSNVNIPATKLSLKEAFSPKLFQYEFSHAPGCLLRRVRYFVHLLGGKLNTVSKAAKRCEVERSTASRLHTLN